MPKPIPSPEELIETFNKDNNIVEEEIVLPVPDVTPEPVVEPVTPPVEETKETPVVEPEPLFKTKEEVDEYVSSKFIEAMNKTRSDELSLKEEAEVKQYFKDGYIPKDLNILATDLLPILTKEIEDKINKNKAQKDQQQSEINQTFDQQLDVLVKAGKIPAADTVEGKKALSDMIAIGVKHGKIDIDSSYELWSQIPEELNGGYKTQTVQKQKMNVQKQAAGMVAGLGAGDYSPAKIDAKKFRTTDLNTLIEEGLESYK